MKSYSDKWWDESRNPIRGCTKISPGCENCYACELMLKEGVNPHRITLNNDHLRIPQSWRKSRKIFLVSMSDMFHQAVPDEYIDLIFMHMKMNPHHKYLIITKRPLRMRDYCRKYYDQHGNFPRYVWLGVTAEDQQRADERIPILLDTISHNHFVSVEPLLEPLKLMFEANKRKLKWVVIGGEKILSRQNIENIRKMDADWAREIRDQCAANNVEFFMKQMNITPYKKDEIPPDLYIKQFPQGLR